MPKFSAANALGLASVLRWLGPWASPASVPRGIERERRVFREGEITGRRARHLGRIPSESGPHRLEAYVYRPPAPPLGTWLISPGIHFDGPDDPRLDRFCRVLASGRQLVIAPFLPGYLELVIDPSAADDLELIARRIIDEVRSPVSIFSISFGSYPALEVSSRLRHAIDGVVTFGGYAEFESAIRFCVEGVMQHPSGAVKLARDPLNQPALFINMLPYLEVRASARRELAEAWREMTYRTWGRMDLKAPGRLEPFAHEIAPTLASDLRELFLIGCGVVPGGAELVSSALARAERAFSFASPARAIRELTAPVVVCHGHDDDVIPWGEAEKLHALLAERVPAKLLLTGLYGHTGAGRLSLRALGAEVKTLLTIADLLSRGGRIGERRAGPFGSSL